MKLGTVVLVFVVGLACCIPLSAQEQPEAAPLKVAVVTGGHGFEEKPFFALFEGYPDIRYTHLKVRDGSEFLEDITDWDYDVLVLYNMSNDISAKRQQNLLKLLDQGVGLFVMHHAIANYPEWPEYIKLIGAAYFRKPTTLDGVDHPRSEYTHDLDVDVHVEDPGHPITKGMKDFTINDEVYRKWVYYPDGNHLLLTTQNPESNTQLAWVKEYRKARVFFVQLGHGPGAYNNENFRQIVVRGMRWCARRL